MFMQASTRATFGHFGCVFDVSRRLLGRDCSMCQELISKIPNLHASNDLNLLK